MAAYKWSDMSVWDFWDVTFGYLLEIDDMSKLFVGMVRFVLIMCKRNDRTVTPSELWPFCLPHSLSQYSEDNMMDPYNLAICFGPTLMSVPEGHDQVSCQAHVNELIKTIIIHHDTIFPGPQDLQGPIYTIPGAGDDFWWAKIPGSLSSGWINSNCSSW